MFDIGGSELLVIGIVALIVVGPKDLPGMFRTLGQFTAKARGMAREFSRAMEDAANATGVKEAADDLKGLTSKKALGLDALDEAAAAFEKWDPKLKGGFTPGPLPDPKPAKPSAPDATPTAAPTAAPAATPTAAPTATPPAAARAKPVRKAAKPPVAKPPTNAAPAESAVAPASTSRPRPPRKSVKGGEA